MPSCTGCRSPTASPRRPGPRARSRSMRAAGRRRRAASVPSTISPAAQQDSARGALGSADDVDARVDAVAQVDVEVPGLTPHGRVAGGRAHPCVRAGIGDRPRTAPVIRLDLRQPHGDRLAVHDGAQDSAEQPWRDVGRQARRSSRRAARSTAVIAPAPGTTHCPSRRARRRPPAAQCASRSLARAAAHAAQSPKMSTMCSASMKPFAAAVRRAHCSTSVASISTATPHDRQMRW